MPKYNIRYCETVYYQETEVNAKDREEAKDKFIDMLNDGKVIVRETSQEDIEIEIL